MAIAYEVADGIAEIRFDRPEKLNALTLAMYDQLGEAWRAARDDDAVRVVLLTGAGERAFCVGADLTESIPALASDQFDISRWDPAHLKDAPFHKPIVAAVNGLCLGGGFELLLATDIRIAAADASFGFPEPTMGFVPAGGTLVRLQRQIGYAAAMELLLTGERFDAEHLLRVGVLNRVVAPGELHATARGVAERIASLSAQAVQTTKQSVLELADLPLADAFAREARLGQRTFTSDDAREGLRAFAERRAPDFRGSAER
ncbi:enoyl-CoA hydratase/isomerase family protein [Conexibacter arvalis]|uniref:Enoyl-CoA hydratase/carnithine racemase n=1 Tax=Conexibacter arvalis TaxID=912552 RepID=A0A840IE54_9ACTN|nr:enoyl-CoA hydratase-related protein [Conexibacter arvalis]MBB4662220.1 enoyl-CoA hydratase/carnithine racemase [Conexibacter arvalis]